MIELEFVREMSMKELVEKLEFRKWTHLFLNSLPEVYEGEVSQFYSNFQLLEENTMNSTIKRV